MRSVTRGWNSLTSRQAWGLTIVDNVILIIIVLGARVLLEASPDWLGGALALLAGASLLAGVVIYGFGTVASQRAGMIAIAGGVFVYLVLALNAYQSGWGYWALWILAIIPIYVIVGLMLEARASFKLAKEAGVATHFQR